MFLDKNNILIYHPVKLFTLNLENNSFKRVGIFSSGIIEYIASIIKINIATRDILQK